MEGVKKRLDLVLDGFFYFFGLTENPASKATEDIRKDSSAQKIQNDLKRINKNFRENYLKMRKEILYID